MSPKYNTVHHIRARNYTQASYDSTRASFKYYTRQNNLTEEMIVDKFGDVWNDMTLMQQACDTMKQEKLMKRRRRRAVTLLQREVDRLDAIES